MEISNFVPCRSTKEKVPKVFSLKMETTQLGQAILEIWLRYSGHNDAISLKCYSRPITNKPEPFGSPKRHPFVRCDALNIDGTYFVLNSSKNTVAGELKDMARLAQSVVAAWHKAINDEGREDDTPLTYSLTLDFPTMGWWHSVSTVYLQQVGFERVLFDWKGYASPSLRLTEFELLNRVLSQAMPHTVVTVGHGCVHLTPASSGFQAAVHFDPSDATDILDRWYGGALSAVSALTKRGKQDLLPQPDESLDIERFAAVHGIVLRPTNEGVNHLLQEAPLSRGLFVFTHATTREGGSPPWLVVAFSTEYAPRVLLAGHQLKNVEEYLSWWESSYKDDEATKLIPRRRMDLEEPWVVCENIEAATARLQCMAGARGLALVGSTGVAYRVSRKAELCNKDRVIDQIFGTCWLASVLTLFVRVGPLFRMLSEDLQSVIKLTKRIGKLQANVLGGHQCPPSAPREPQCPSLPPNFLRYCREGGRWPSSVRFGWWSVPYTPMSMSLEGGGHTNQAFYLMLAYSFEQRKKSEHVEVWLDTHTHEVVTSERLDLRGIRVWLTKCCAERPRVQSGLVSFYWLEKGEMTGHGVAFTVCDGDVIVCTYGSCNLECIEQYTFGKHTFSEVRAILIETPGELVKSNPRSESPPVTSEEGDEPPRSSSASSCSLM